MGVYCVVASDVLHQFLALSFWIKGTLSGYWVYSFEERDNNFIEQSDNCMAGCSNGDCIGLLITQQQQKGFIQISWRLSCLLMLIRFAMGKKFMYFIRERFRDWDYDVCFVKSPLLKNSIMSSWNKHTYVEKW